MKDSTRLAIVDIFSVTPLTIRNQDTQRDREEVQHPLVIDQFVKTSLVKIDCSVTEECAIVIVGHL